MAKRIGVVGAGTMGRGIAESCLKMGYEVLLLDASAELADEGCRALERSFQRGVERGRMTSQEKEGMLKRLACSQDYGCLQDVGIVFEAVFEDLDTKKSVLAEISRVVPKDGLIGSNTSSLSISEMAASVTNPGRFLGIHFFNPVPVMKLVEIIKGVESCDESVKRAYEFCTEIGKTPIVVKESPGFVVNRLLCPMLNEAAYLLADGVASVQDIDTAMRLGANHPMGPLSLADLIGIDVLYAIMKTLHEDLGDDKYKPCPLLKQMVLQGRLGRKTKRGFFEYP